MRSEFLSIIVESVFEVLLEHPNTLILTPIQTQISNPMSNFHPNPNPKRNHAIPNFNKMAEYNKS